MHKGMLARSAGRHQEHVLDGLTLLGEGGSAVLGVDDLEAVVAIEVEPAHGVFVISVDKRVLYLDSKVGVKNFEVFYHVSPVTFAAVTFRCQ